MTDTTTPATASGPAASRRFPGWVPTPTTASALYLLLLIFAIFAFWIPDVFYSGATFKLVLSNQVVTGIVALALLVPFVAGAFDLSVGYMVAFSLAIVSVLRQDHQVDIWLCALTAIATCGLVGLISGLITVKLRVNSFIATLGVGQVLAALTLYLSKNQQIVGAIPDSFQDLLQGNLLGLPKALYVFIAIAAVIYYVLEWTPIGRNLFATGANLEAARLAGLRTDRLIIGSLVTSGLIAGFAGVVLGAQTGLFSTSFGIPLLFPAFAALFFGATQFKNRPNVWGTVLAAYTLAFGVQGLQLGSGAGAYWITPLFNGAALLLAVGFASRVAGVPFKLGRRRRETPTAAA